MEFFENYGSQIIAACIAGSVVGFVIRLRFYALVLSLPIVSGLIALAVTGDWRDFFRYGITIAHPIYLAGHCMIAVVLFGPFGLACGVAARGVRVLIAHSDKTRFP